MQSLGWRYYDQLNAEKSRKKVPIKPSRNGQMVDEKEMQIRNVTY